MFKLILMRKREREKERVMMRENKIFFANKMEERHFDLLEEDIFTSTHTFTTSHFSLPLLYMLLFTTTVSVSRTLFLRLRRRQLGLVP